MSNTQKTTEAKPEISSREQELQSAYAQRTVKQEIRPKGLESNVPFTALPQNVRKAYMKQRENEWRNKSASKNAFIRIVEEN